MPGKIITHHTITIMPNYVLTRQVGWATDKWKYSLVDHKSGVGDDQNSWAYDGFRMRKWNGIDVEYGTREWNNGSWKERTTWRAGDCVGCFIQIERKCEFSVANISFSLNGNYLGTAFRDVIFELEGIEGIFPALSCEEGEIVRCNHTSSVHLIRVSSGAREHRPETIPVHMLGFYLD